MTEEAKVRGERRTVHVHIGTPKSGTTFLQRTVAKNRALLHESGGFGLVLGMAAAFGLVIWLSAIGFLALARGGGQRSLAPAE